MQPKVLYVIDTLEVGGAERSTLEIASRLENWHPFICHIYKGNALLQEYSFSDSQVFSMELSGPYQFLKAVRLFSEVLTRVKPDLVVASLLRSELVARYCCYRNGIPIVGTFVNDSYCPYEMSEGLRSLRFKIRFFQVLNAISARWCASFLSNSSSIKTSNARALLIPESNIRVIPRGRKVPNQFPARQVINTSQPVFCNVGRLIRRKGQMELLQAFHLLLSDYPEAVLKIAGEGLYRHELEHYSNQNDLCENVEFCGTVKNMEEFFQNADIAVFSSWYEGFSGAVLEAALAGVPMILSDIAMNREVVPPDGGIFFPVKNVQALYQCMVDVLTNAGETPGRAMNAFEFAAEHFAIEEIVSKHEGYYHQVLIDTK